MKNNWMIDVLADLQTFARQNGLEELDQQLDRTARVARYEMATKLGDASAKMRTVARDAGSLHRPAGAGSNA